MRSRDGNLTQLATSARRVAARARSMLFALIGLVSIATGAFAAGSEIDGPALARKAAEALAKSQFSEAIALYTQALRDRRLTNDRKGVILTERAVVYARLNAPARAIADFNQAATLFPENAVTYNNRGAFLVSLGALDEGLKDFDRALLLAPGYVAAWNNRAAAHAKADRRFAAISDYTRAIRLASTLAEPLVGRANIYLLQSRPRAALRDLDRALATDQRLAAAYRTRAEALLALKRYEDATQDLSRAIAYDPVDVKAYALRGFAYLRAKDLPAALRDYAKVVELDPRSGDGYRERGHVNILLDDFEAAERDLTRALEINPRDPIVFAYRALMYKKRDQAELGAQEIVKAEKLAPNNAIVLWARGEIEEARGLADEAVESYRKALAADPDLELPRLGLRRILSEAPSDTIELPSSGGKGWRVVLEGTRYFASHTDHDGLKVPLEMAGTGRPKILDWTEKTGTYEDVGVLRFSAGNVPVGKGEQPMQYAALIDLKSGEVVALIPDKLGEVASQWRWGQDGRLTVASIDGLTTAHALRKQNTPKTVPGPTATGPVGNVNRRRRRRPSNVAGGGTPSWAPWADNRRRTSNSRGRRNRGRRRKSKTLFDLILGN
ncbi:MAG: tetratricopeptide repeat protein [Hyphomicrobiaceae bacterium]|nr:tetratricopeptide repeat protein [Hyphomicrobiaceae bacterium]